MLSVNLDFFSPSRFSQFHFNSMRKGMKARNNLNTKQEKK